MFTKRKILEKKLRPALEAEYTMIGEPLIYSIKYAPRHRMRPVHFFRTIQHRSMIRCYFDDYRRADIPVVLLVRFYVSPPESETISVADLESEKRAAVKAHELCDYLLAFLEVLKDALVHNYRQFVKIDVQKFYSSNPRTVFQFIRYDYYVKLQNRNPANAETQSVSAVRVKGRVQPEYVWDVATEGESEESDTGEFSIADWSSVCDNPLSYPSDVESSRKTKNPQASVPTHEKARRGQPRKVPE